MACVVRVASFDPGGTTGVAWHDMDNLPTDPSLDQLATPDHHLRLFGFLDKWQPELVVCEDFLYRQQHKADLQAVQYIGVLRLWCIARETRLIMQTPSTGKAFWTDDKLKRINLYQKGIPHARDALRHLLHYYTFTAGLNYYIDRLK